jgi:hypothetical protein
MFFFQTMFQTVYTGITNSLIVARIEAIAEGILLLCALFGLYEAWAKGGDVRALAVVGVRYLIMSLIISQYPLVFLGVNSAANDIAATISPTDLVTNFRTQLATYWNSVSGLATWFNVIPGVLTGILSLVFQLIAVLIFPITYTLFALFYSMYGAVLYVVGPLVLAFYPTFGIGQLARTYMINLLIWNAWGIIYAIMSQLLTIMNAGSLDTVLSAGSFGGFFAGASQALLIALSSILISLMIALIPFIATRIVSGDVGSTLFAVLGAAAAAITTAAAAVSGVGAGLGASGGRDGGGGGGGTSNMGSNRPPTPPPDKTNQGTENNSGESENTGSNTAPRPPEQTAQTKIGDSDSAGQMSSESRSTGGDTSKKDGGGGTPQPPDRNGYSGKQSASRSSHQGASGLMMIPYAAGWVTGNAMRATAHVFGSGKAK